MKVYIFAQSYQHAFYWASRQKLLKHEWIYVKDSQDLCGVVSGYYFEYKTFRQNQNWSFLRILLLTLIHQKRLIPYPTLLEQDYRPNELIPEDYYL